MMHAETRPTRVLFLCTGNSARSQMAEAVLNHIGKGKFIAESAGSHPAQRVHPFALDALREAGITWRGHPPRGLEGLELQPWDLVITVCDHAREACPVFLQQPLVVHWGMSDPAALEGDDRLRREGFRAALALIRHRIDRLLSLPISTSEPGALREQLTAIGSGDFISS